MVFMKRDIISLSRFKKRAAEFVKRNQLLIVDLDNFKKELSSNPEMGDVIPGVDGLRKARLKSSNKGKSGGFRVCYYYFVLKNRIYLMDIYAKNQQEDMSSREKMVLKEFINFIKGVTHE